MISPTPSLHTSSGLVRLGALLVVLTITALAGCSPTPTPTPTTTPAFASEEEAFAAAEETYRAYNDALNAVDLSDPSSFEPVFALSSGDFEAADRRTLSELHAESYRFTGKTFVSDFKGVSSAPPFETIIASICLDVSASDVVDQSGLSVADPERAKYNSLRVTFRQSGGKLSIDRADREDQMSCAP